MAISNLPPFAAPCKTRDLPAIQIGPKLKQQLWLEALKIAREHEHCRDVHEKRRLQRNFSMVNSVSSSSGFAACNSRSCFLIPNSPNSRMSASMPGNIRVCRMLTTQASVRLILVSRRAIRLRKSYGVTRCGESYCKAESA
jgi:hypothetical protein